jgi:hypothetical protein
MVEFTKKMYHIKTTGKLVYDRLSCSSLLFLTLPSLIFTILAYAIKIYVNVIDVKPF